MTTNFEQIEQNNSEILKIIEDTFTVNTPDQSIIKKRMQIMQNVVEQIEQLADQYIQEQNNSKILKIMGDIFNTKDQSIGLLLIDLLAKKITIGATPENITDKSNIFFKPLLMGKKDTLLFGIKTFVEKLSENPKFLAPKILHSGDIKLNTDTKLKILSNETLSNWEINYQKNNINADPTKDPVNRSPEAWDLINYLSGKNHQNNKSSKQKM